MNLAQLTMIMPHAGPKAGIFLPLLNASMAEFDITTLARQASFLSQVGHESMQFLYLRELASGAAYEGRLDLGNTQPGDGAYFKGRGLIQITGRTHYVECGSALDLDLTAHPQLLEQPLYACRSAGWFWKTFGLNQLADGGDQERVTRRINGGLNGLADRLALFAVAQRVLA